MLKKAFTIIELLIGIFVLIVGLVGALGAFPLGAKVAKSSQMASVATQLAQEKMEEIISQPYLDISSEPREVLSFPFNAYEREVEVSCYDPNGTGVAPDCPDTDIKQVRVAVFWKSPLGVTVKKVEIFSLIAKK